MFEVLQGTTWNDIRLKPPPSLDSDIGWRVEFRTVDCQITPEQNFLFTHAILVLFRLLTCDQMRLNFYIPISLCDENFKRANLINAATEQKFFFRTNIYDDGEPVVEELYIKEIFAGKGDYEGINSLIDKFIDINSSKLEEEASTHGTCPIQQIRATYDYLYKISTGAVPTGSQIIREFVTSHPEYQQDSLTTEGILNDLTTYMLRIQNKKMGKFNAIFDKFIKCE
jgi:glutamate--cysteine ligase catalytic subunit